MPKLPEQFTFSTPETQESFEKLPEIAKQRMIEASMEEAKIIQEKVERGEASSYSEALGQYRATVEESSGEIFEIKGKDAAIILQELFEKEKLMYPPPEGYDVADLHWDKYADLLCIEIFKHEVGTEIREGKIYKKEEYLAGEVNGIGFSPLMSLVSKESHPEFKRRVEEIINNSFFNHSVNGWMSHRSREGGLAEAVSDIESNRFTDSHGFFVTPTHNAWAERFMGDSANVIYFNDRLMQFVAPTTPDELAALDTVDKELNDYHSHGSLRPGGYPMANDKLDSVLLFPTHDATTGNREGAGLCRIALLLGKKDFKLSFFNDALGAFFIAPASIEEQGKEGYGRVLVTLRIGPLDPELAQILTTSEDEIIEPGVFRKRLTISSNNKKEIDANGKVPILMPIQRIVPNIVTGMIEYEKFEVEKKKPVRVKRIAVPRGNSFVVYNQNMTEVTEEK